MRIWLLCNQNDFCGLLFRHTHIVKMYKDKEVNKNIFYQCVT